jgi:hypothetical protein
LPPVRLAAWRADVAEAQPSFPAAPVPEAVERLPALGGAQLVRVRGRRPSGAAPASPPVLVVGEQRFESLAEPLVGRDRAAFGGTYVVGAEAVGRPAWLEWPDGERIPLPAEEPPAAAPPPVERPPAWVAHRTVLERELARATAAAAVAEARLDAEAIARGALTRELERLGEALAAERVARDGLDRELRAARADLLAARRVRAAEAAALAGLRGELEAERAARAVARETAARLARELAAVRRRAAPPAAEPAAAGRPSASPAEKPAAAASPGDLRRLALTQAAAAAGRRPAAETGRVAADLDAAAAALRRSATPPPRRLRDALVSLAREDAHAAGLLLAQLLPAQGAVVAGPLSYDLVIRGVGTYAVTLGDGPARVIVRPRPRPPGQAELALTADPLALAEWLAGRDVRIGRLRGPIRRRGRRRALAPLRALPAGTVSLTEAARAGARPDPGLVYRALAHAVPPEWTRGHRFTVAQALDGETWFVTADDGARLSVSATPPERPPDATVTLTREAFDRLLRDEPPLPGARPTIRGDRAAVATLREWAERARAFSAPSAPHAG